MANILTQNPFVIDTPGTSVLTSMQLFVRAVAWEGDTASAIGDRATVQDLSGNLFYDKTANGANFNDFASFSTQGKTGRYLNGLKVPTLGHGKLFIYLD